MLAMILSASAATPLEGFVGAGIVTAMGEGSGVDIWPTTALLRARVLAREGPIVFGGDLDERFTFPLASRKSGLVGIGSRKVGVDLLTGIGLVERGLFGRNARIDLHMPVELSLMATGSVTAWVRGRTWWTMWDNAQARTASHLPTTGGLEVAAGFGIGGPALEVGWREEFGYDVFMGTVGITLP